MMLLTLRKGTAAAHYLMCGPQANRHNAFTIATGASEVYAMHGDTAAVASFSRRLIKEKDAGQPIEPVIDKMNQQAREYYDNSRPEACAKSGLIDEIVKLTDLRKYFKAFAGAVYQNPKSICPHHLMVLPRIIKG